MSVLKNLAPRYLFSVITIIILAQYFFDITSLQELINVFQDSSVIIAAFALPIGIINLLRRELPDIMRRKGEWYLNIWMIFLIAFVGALGIIYGTKESTYNYLYSNIQLPSDAALYALVGFYLAPGAYRAFRIRSWDSLFLLVTLVFLMFYNIPVGAAIWGGFKPIGAWLEANATTTGFRVIWLGFGVSMAALLVRYISMRESAIGD